MAAILLEFNSSSFVYAWIFDPRRRQLLCVSVTSLEGLEMPVDNRMVPILLEFILFTWIFVDVVK